MERSDRRREQSSSDIISTENGTKYEVSWSSIMDEKDSGIEGENVPAPESPEGSSRGGLDIPLSSLHIPDRPAGRTQGRGRIECDHCGQRDLATYYHCRSCPDSDLCSNCVSQGCQSSPHHELIQVRQSSKSPSHSSETMPAGRGDKSKIDCDRCSQLDMVKYYRCRTCPRFDLCEQCYVDKHRRCEVSSRHRFEKTQYVDGRERVI